MFFFNCCNLLNPTTWLVFGLGAVAGGIIVALGWW
jgi:hypothetical protein